MDTYDSSLAPRFSQLLAQREAELRAVLHANDHLPDEASGVKLLEVVDFKDVAAEQSRTAVAEAKVEHAAHELELVLAAGRLQPWPFPGLRWTPRSAAAHSPARHTLLHRVPGHSRT